ncbi:MAG: ArnT family glycosyltransferase [Anaerolineae bacterium]
MHLRAICVICVLFLGLALRLAPIADDPLHPDECLYASWALSVADGSDVMLRSADIDKPPVYPYLLAAWSALAGTGPTALRLLGIAAAAGTLTSLLVLFDRLYGRAAALAGLVLVALSPVAIALDGTALTDPAAVAFALLASLAAANGRGVAAGALLGLAAATKPQLLAYLPLVLLLLPRPWRRAWVRVAMGVLAVAAAVAVWEVVRAAPRTFVAAAVDNYGLLGGSSPGAALALTWLPLLRWILGDPWAIGLSGIAVAIALVLALFARANGRATLAASGAALSIAGYLAGSLALGMPAWDRYALPLVPLCGLLLAWAASVFGARLRRLSWAPGAALALALGLMLLAPAREAAASRLPLGDTSRWGGIEGVAAYVRGQVPGRATVLYRDLGWQLRYYLRGFPQDFRWVPDEGSLVADAARAEPCYVLVPAETAGEEMSATLRAAGMRLRPAYVAYRHDGSASMTLYLVDRSGP